MKQSRASRNHGSSRSPSGRSSRVERNMWQSLDDDDVSPHRNRADYFPGHQRVLVFRSAIIYLALSLVQQPGPSCPATLRKRLYCTSYSLSATRPPSRTSVELCGDHHLLDDKTSQDFCYKRYIAAALHREETEGFCGFGLVASSRSVPLPLLAT